MSSFLKRTYSKLFMKRTFFKFLILGLAIAALFKTTISLIPSSEFQISPSADYSQFLSRITTDSNGNLIVVWQSKVENGNDWDIFARRYDATGKPLGKPFKVNTFTPNNQFVARVAVDSKGNFTIIWESEGQDGSRYGIYCKQFNSSGVPLGSEFRVNSTTANSQHNPAIAMTPGGDFVVAWVSDEQDGSQEGIFAKRFSADGIPQGGEFQVNTYTTDTQRRPNVAMDASGNFVIIWDSTEQDGSGRGIYGQRFNAEGISQGDEFRVNTFTANEQSANWLAMDATGNFIVVWQSEGQDGSGFGIYGQRFNAAGIAHGNEFLINTYRSLDQRFPVVSMTPSGEFVVVWDSVGQDGNGRGVFGQRFNADGVAVSSEFQANSYNKKDQLHPDVSIAPDGSFVVAWISVAQDGAFESIFGKRYDSSGNPLNTP